MSDLEDGMDQVTLGDKRVEINTFDRYKGRKGVTDRIAVISKVLIRARTHYVEKKKKTIRCISTKDKQGACCKHLGDGDQKFGLVLFQYLTDENGQLLTEEKLSGKVKLWIITDTRYAELSALHKEFPLMDGGWDTPQVDITIKCTEENFQRMTLTPCKEAFWKRKKEWYDALKAKDQKAGQRLPKAMGAELSEMEILELLEVDAGSSPTGPAGGGDIDLDDVLD